MRCLLPWIKPRSLVSGRKKWVLALVLVFLLVPPSASEEDVDGQPWLLAKAYHIPSEYTNQESGYFSIIAGHNGLVYIGTAKYGVNCFLVEFDPVQAVMKMVVDVHRTIHRFLKGFGAQAKIHSRNNVGASGKIYVATKQGYPEKGEKRTDYPGGYVVTYDPKTGQAEHFGIAKEHHGIISVTPDEGRGVAYISTCDDGRPIEHSHFMILDLKKKTYRDLGDCQHSYAFIVLDHQGRAYHPLRGGRLARYDPDADKLEKLEVTVDGAKVPEEIAKDGAILNWETAPDGKTLYAVEMSTNQLYAFDLTATGTTIPGRRLGALLPNTKQTDCRALCVGPTGLVWAAVTDHGRKGGTLLHLVGYTPGQKAPRDYGPVGIANPDYTPFTNDQGKPLPWHHTVRKEKDGTLTPWVPLGIAAGRDGSVYITTLAPFTLLRLTKDQLK